MLNNDVLRRVRYIFDFNDKKMINFFGLGGLTVDRAQMSSWLKKEDDADFNECKDRELSVFLNGLIIHHRGARDGGPPTPDHRLNNNMILTKLKIALSLTSDDLLDVMKLADFTISKHELSAFFRKSDHKHYRDCLDQVLRNALFGLQRKYRDSTEEPIDDVADTDVDPDAFNWDTRGK